MFQNEKFGAQIQKHVKELVGHELNPALYPSLFDQIKVCVDKFFDATGQVRPFLGFCVCLYVFDMTCRRKVRVSVEKNFYGKKKSWVQENVK